VLLRFPPFVSLELTYPTLPAPAGLPIKRQPHGLHFAKAKLIIFIDEYPLRHDLFVYPFGTEVPIRSANLLSVCTEPMAPGISAELTLATGSTIDFQYFKGNYLHTATSRKRAYK